jgi:hypothetical protein
MRCTHNHLIVPTSARVRGGPFCRGGSADHPPAQTEVYIVENEITYLAFPPVPDAIVLFGGYAVSTVEPLRWLGRCQLRYWGDIEDTLGSAVRLEQERISYAAVEQAIAAPRSSASM